MNTNLNRSASNHSVSYKNHKKKNSIYNTALPKTLDQPLQVSRLDPVRPPSSRNPPVNNIFGCPKSVSKIKQTKEFKSSFRSPRDKSEKRIKTARTAHNEPMTQSVEPSAPSSSAKGTKSLKQFMLKQKKDLKKARDLKDDISNPDKDAVFEN